MKNGDERDQTGMLWINDAGKTTMAWKTQTKPNQITNQIPITTTFYQ
jgi:hypothetical protein